MSRPIDSDTWRRIDVVLDKALDLSGEERDRYVEEACAGDDDLRAHVEEMIDADERAGGFLEEPADEYAGTLLDDLVPHDEDELESGVILGAWRLAHVIGRGGMGTVYLADRANAEFEQRAAVKVVRPGLDSRMIRARFLQERRILAGLQHPNIAGLLDGGVTSDGTPWFAMEFVDGTPITEFADERRLPIEDRLGLFRDACSAVAHAQQHLVVHRDLKPSNILVTEEKEVKLLDFGIAKLFTEDEGVTLTGESRPHTPAYAAPEQLLGESVTTATDVWALGCILYELLSGHHPHQAPTRRGRELERAILEEPSRHLARAVDQETRMDDGLVTSDLVSNRRRTTPRRLRQRLSGDLSNIVGRALQKDSALRYPSAAAFREDLERHRLGLPVEARAPSVAYRARKFFDRNRIGVLAAMVVLLSLVGGLAATTWQARRADREAIRATETRDFLVNLFEEADPAQALGREVTAREILGAGAARIDTELADAPDVRAEMLRIIGRIQLNLGAIDEAESLFVRTLALRREIYGEDHGLFAESLIDLGSVMHAQSRFDAADSLLTLAVSTRRRESGDQARLATAVLNLASAKSALGDYEAAEPLYREAIEIDRRIHGPRHVEVAADLNNYGVFLGRFGRREESEAAHREALSIRRESLPQFHPDVAASLSNLGDLLASRGELEEADAKLREAVEIRRHLYDGSHPRLAISLRHLAGVRQRLEDLEGAEALYLEALAMSRVHVGDIHTDVATCINELATNAFYRRDLDVARSRFAESLAIFEQLLPAGHPTLLTLGNNLATVALESGHVDQAEEVYAWVLKARTEKFGARHPQVGEAWIAIGNVHGRRGDWADAATAYFTAVDIHRESSGNDDLGTANARGFLGRALTWDGSEAAGEEHLRAALQVYRERFPDGHRRIRAMETDLARALEAGGLSEEALQIATSAEAWARESFGEGDGRTAEAQAVRGRCLAALGRTDEARSALDGAIEILAATRGEDHPQTRDARSAREALR